MWAGMWHTSRGLPIRSDTITGIKTNQLKTKCAARREKSFSSLLRLRVRRKVQSTRPQESRCKISASSEEKTSLVRKGSQNEGPDCYKVLSFAMSEEYNCISKAVSLIVEKGRDSFLTSHPPGSLHRYKNRSSKLLSPSSRN